MNNIHLFVYILTWCTSAENKSTITNVTILFFFCFFPQNLLSLDLVPLVPLGTLGSSLMPVTAVHCSVISFFPCDVEPCQDFWNVLHHVFLQCPLLHLPSSGTGVDVIAIFGGQWQGREVYVYTETIFYLVKSQTKHTMKSPQQST